MTYTTHMHSTFEAEKNKKAFTYTALICGVMLLLAFFITWPILAPTAPVAQDLLEINLGNNNEGYGEEQPLIKGEMAPRQEQPAPQPQQSAAKAEPAKDIQAEDDAEEDAAPVTKAVKSVKQPTEVVKQAVTKPVTTASTAPVTAPAPKPQKPKVTYAGPGNGSGNGATEDNGYKYQGNKPGGTGDAGDPSGKPDSYGSTPGGKVGGLRVSKGDRTIRNNYIFMADLPKATINAIIRVTPDGKGSYVSMDKGSTSSDSRYVDRIRSYLPNIQFSKSDHTSLVTVPFNFKVQ